MIPIVADADSIDGAVFIILETVLSLPGLSGCTFNLLLHGFAFLVIVSGCLHEYSLICHS